MTSGLDLLKSLGLSARGAQMPRAGASAAPATIGGMSFADLLGKVTGGEFSSGQQVTVAKDAGVQLTDDQLQRLSKIADAAEAQGASRLLVLMDGQAFKLDVGVRQVMGAADVSGVVTGVDAVVAAPIGGATATNAATTAPIRPLGNVLSSNASLINALASIGK